MSKVTRRVFLRTTTLGAAVGGSLVALAGCSKDELSCTDTSSLTAQEQTARTNLAYTEPSPHGATKNCTNCNFFTAGGQNQCGSCTLIKGPINPNGYCNSWAAKQS